MPAWSCNNVPAWSSNNMPTYLLQQQQPAAFGGRRRLRRRCCCCWTRPRQGRQGRQDRPRPDQAKARHNKQASQAKAGWSLFFLLLMKRSFHFRSQSQPASKRFILAPKIQANLIPNWPKPASQHGFEPPSHFRWSMPASMKRTFH